MALFQIKRGNSANIPAVSKDTDGCMYYCVDTAEIFIDYYDESDGVAYRKKINAAEAERLAGYNVVPELSTDDSSIPTSKAVHDVTAELSATILNNYNESIIGLSVDGQVVTYIKGDGSKHTFVTQDTNTTYSLGTDEVTGLTKLYATTGSAEDGTMTQKAIKTELDKKVGVSIDDANDMLIFTI